MATDFESRHAAITSASRTGGPLDTYGPNATIKNPRWFEPDGTPLPDRLRMHQRILEAEDAAAGRIARDRQVLVVSGPPGAGKSTMTTMALADLGTDPQTWRRIDWDEMKDRLLVEMIEEGTLDGVIPDELRSMDLKPRELATLVHAESGLLADQLLATAMSRGENIVLEETPSNQQEIIDLLTYLQNHDYTVHLASVDTSKAIATERTMARHQSGLETDEKLGGRFVPAVAIDSCYDQDGNSVSAPIMDAVLESESGPADCLQSLRRYTVDRVDAAPELTDVRTRDSDFQPIDLQAYRAIQVSRLPAARSHDLSTPTTKPTTRRPDGPGLER